MKLSEIEEQLKIANNIPLNKDGSSDWWYHLPRIPYNDLPSKLKKNVREEFTPAKIKEFLLTCYSIDQYEELTAGISDHTMETIFITTRNNSIFTIEYVHEDAPEDDKKRNYGVFLYGNHATGSFEKTLSMWKEKHKSKDSKSNQEKEIPKKDNINDIKLYAGKYQIVISDKEYRYALTANTNKTAFVTLMNDDFFNNINFENGVIFFDGKITGTINEFRQGKYENISTLDFPLLVQIYTATYRSKLTWNEDTITIYLPQFFHEMGISMKHGQANDIIKKLHSFEKCVGIMPNNKSMYKLITILSIDLETNTMKLAVPYITKLISILETKNTKKLKKSENSYITPHMNFLIHSTIVKERNKPAVELLYNVTSAMLTRGGTPDAKTYAKNKKAIRNQNLITYEISFKSLLKDSALLNGRLKSYNDTSDKNKALKRAFLKFYEILESKTDAKYYFINLKINKIIPTMTTLNNKLTITWTGINGDYQPDQ